MPSPPRHYKIKEDFVIEETSLGSGTTSRVWIAWHTGTKDLMVGKVINPPTEKEHALLEAGRQEGNLMATLDHPNIVKLHHQHHSTRGYIAFVFEYCKGGSLQDYLHKPESRSEPQITRRKRCPGPEAIEAGWGHLVEEHRPSIPPAVLSEGTAKRLFRQLIEGLAYLKSVRVAHWDIKPANLLLTSGDLDTAVLKIADFGTSHRFTGQSDLTPTSVGTPHYMPLEMLKMDPCGYAADIWSAGIVLHLMVLGKVPIARHPLSMSFDGWGSEFARQINKTDYLAHLRASGLSPECKDLLCLMLHKDQKERITHEEILRHPFLSEATS